MTQKALAHTDRGTLTFTRRAAAVALPSSVAVPSPALVAACVRFMMKNPRVPALVQQAVARPQGQARHENSAVRSMVYPLACSLGVRGSKERDVYPEGGRRISSST